VFFKRKIISVFLVLSILFNLALPTFANEVAQCKYCDFSNLYIGEDKYENFNRKMFNLNKNLNKYIARPVHILWSSIMPQYGINRIQGIYDNIEYPKRLASCILQKDFAGVKNETKRFLTNTTLGLGGMFDPAKKFFKLNPIKENMDQALCKCKLKSGPYLVMPVLSSSCPRSLLGRLLEAALDPSVYLASPLTSIIKGGFVVNKTSFMQPFAKMIESTYADPYEINKKLYGIENYIKTRDLDRKDLLTTDAKILETEENIIANTSKENLKDVENQIKQIQEEESILNGLDELASNSKTQIKELEADIYLTGYNSQSPVVDSMRTALFEIKDINKSIWNELSIWNRSFAQRIKTDSINIFEERDNYKFRYILQKDKNAPLAIFYPSIGEGVNSHHSTVFAKLFYDEGYSVIIQGSHFQWEFAKSMPEGYCPGLPAVDCDNLKLVTRKIIDKLEKEHKRNFSERILVGTSLGAMATLFVADKESKNNTLNISKFIAISPPIELVYAIEQVDKNSEIFNTDSEASKHKFAITAAKVLQISEQKKNPNFKFKEMPFSEDEGKLITSFLMRQKLSDLVYTIEGNKTGKKSDFYNQINNMSFTNYAEKYLLAESGNLLENITFDTSLFAIADYLKNNDNYKIYESFDDFLINKNQLTQLKEYSPKNVVCLNNGSHLGFLYRDEFLNSFKKDIELNKVNG